MHDPECVGSVASEQARSAANSAASRSGDSKNDKISDYELAGLITIIVVSSCIIIAIVGFVIYAKRRR